MREVRGVRQAVVSPRIDGTAMLTVYLVALLSIPALLVVPALGTAGSPASILALGGLVVWLLHHARRTVFVDLTSQPVRRAVFWFVLATIVVYVHAMSRPIPSSELTPADSGLLRVLGWSALALIAVDGIDSLERVRALARRLAVAAGLVAIVGLVQVLTKQLWIDQIVIPGLSSRGAEMGLAERAGSVRISGTSIHPIEFGVILTTTLPLLVVHAMRATERRWLYRCLLGVVTLVVFLVISRSAIICASVGLAVLALRWTWKERVAAFSFLTAALAVVYVMMPGMLGLIGSLFTGAGNDSSITSRTDSYAVAFELISRSPVLGRGFGTLSPAYWILDNAYLLDLIERGVVGLVALLVLIRSGAVSARRARKALTDDFDRDLAHAVLAGIASAGIGMAFFDMLSFPQAAGVFFVLLGIGGALHRLSTPGSGQAAERHPAESLGSAG